MKSKNLKAYSLIEMSVVILILGFVIAGVIKGNDMIYEFRLQTARSLTANAPLQRMEGLTVWLETTSEKSFDKTADATSTTKNKVDAWYDLNPQRPNKMDFVQPTSSLQPALVNDSKMNNLPVLLFDGIDDNIYRLNVLGSDFTQRDQITVFFVQKYSPLQPSMLFTWIPASTGQRMTHHSQWVNGDTYWDFSDAGGAGGRINISTAGKYTDMGNITTLIRKPSGVGNIKMNGHKLFSTDAAQTGILDVTASSTFYIGAQVANANAFNGTLGEVIIFNRALKEGEVEAVEKYLSQKWGIKLIP